MEKYCAFTTVSFIVVLIVEAPGHVLTRGRNTFALIVEEKEYVLTRGSDTSVPSANQGAKARSAGLRIVASRAERGEEGLRLPRLLFAGTSMARYCAFTTVAFIIALIVEAPGHVLTRGRDTSVPSANQGAKARSAGLRSVASRAERGEEGLRLPRLLFARTSMEKYCAFTTVSFMFALIVEEEAYVLTRDCATTVPSVNQGAKARSAGLRSVASRAERGEEGLRLPRLLFAGTSMATYCVGIIAISTFANSVLEGAFVHTTTTDMVAKCVETIAESSCIVVIREPSMKRLLLQILTKLQQYRDDELCHLWPTSKAACC
jgi:hypothetical protein